jgi:type I restriction enzyme, S subunit
MRHPNNRTLGEISDEVGGIIRTGPFGSQLHQSDYRKDGLPLIMPKDIINGKVETDGIARIGENDEHRLQEHKLKKGDIVFARRGDLGRCALIRERESGWLCGTGSLRVSLGDTVVDPAYLIYYFNHADIISWIKNRGIGATLPNLNTSIIRDIPISYPPLPVQRKIADVLSAYDDLIEVNTRRIRILEQMAQSVYREWFGKVDVKSLPEGWEIKEIGDVAEVKGGKRLPKGHDVIDEITDHPYLRVRDFTERGLSRNDIKYIDEETYKAVKNYIITNDDIYISIAGTIGRVGIVPVDYSNANLTENAAKICNLSPLVNKHFLLHFLQSSEGQKQIASRVVGTSQPKLALFRIKEIHFPLAPQHIMDKVGKLLSEFAQLIEVLDKKNANLRRTRDLLLPRLVSGEVSVEGMGIEM